MSDLDVCRACGWYAHGSFRPNECDPKLGEVADEISAQAKRIGINTTKLGYGFGQLTFEIDEQTAVTTSPHRNGTFSVENVYMIGRTLPSDVLALVAVLQSIRSRS